MEDFDINEFAKMFDTALASNNPAVKKALRNFLMVAAIVHAPELDTAERTMGPFETLIKKVSDLERMYWDLKNSTVINTNGNYWRNTQNPTWVYNGVTNSTSTSGISSTVATSTSKSTYLGQEINDNDLYTYLNDIKIT